MRLRGPWLALCLPFLAPALADAQDPPAAEEPDVPEGYGVPPTLPAEPSPPPTEPPAGGVRLDVLPWNEDRPLGVRMRAIDGDGESRQRCRAPCSFFLEPGRYEFSVEPRGGDPRLADDQPIWIQGERVTLIAHYDWRGGIRGVGWAFFAMALTAFGLSGIGGPITLGIIGAPLAAGLLIPFFPLVFLNDSAQVRAIAVPP